MKDITIQVKMDGYMREWLQFHLGNPVRFPAKSYENEVLVRYLSKRPKDMPPEAEDAGTVAIVIPDNGYRRPEYYNYLGHRGRRAIIHAIDNLFRLDLWSGCAPLLHSRRELNKGIDAWCQANGISLDSREAVRQKFYRIRRSYFNKGVILGKFYSKKTATIVSEKNQNDGQDIL